MKIVGADPISARCEPYIYSKFSVGDGFPVPRRKAFSYGFGTICVPQITVKCFIINERPCFHRIKPMKTGSFCLRKIYMLKIVS